MRIIAHNAKCQGHARCSAQAPEIFKLDDEGYILPGDIEVAEGEQLRASQGARSCPERALEVDRTSAARFEPAAIQPRAGED
ncbi:MAG: ferredoxin [Mesorhizobium sp.]|uniref:ferredoxin n=1 Tax=unclassified Mesorhizobium TaxID=325217 RepID=UPI000F75E706|nr:MULTISPECIES: ferredoxin [unclassified Mesorhizobium]RVC82326.1 ferredoxin [Mesorhizobium sp. M2A.F.Ca.ET.046.02.1.1]AZO34191.1 ferredoxin [Mesorhizobium sp. M2A.F.Ca.ET.046.03.2.1]AZO71622.1 ferredoxin [Mesorhizobium sp. M1D.F.Ca.ET.043.01.1.1]RWB49800.1 MAG: ferredoxin [Mesorhizobium sp.]RWE22496.1 MAG: ferredoxin [Mesorhizobium sp.]